MKTSDFHETMKLVEEAITKLERGECENPEGVRAFAEEFLGYEEEDAEERPFKDRLRMKEARLRLDKLPRG